MAQLWIPQLEDAVAPYGLVSLRDPAYQLVPVFPYVRRVKTVSAAARGAWLLSDPASAPDHWIFLASAGTAAWLNGEQLRLGVRVLEDRDELRLSDTLRFYFSTERLPEVVPFPGAAKEVHCPRCTMPIKPGTGAVYCGCGVWVHQNDEYPCWRYPGTTTCPCCAQSNDPEAGFRWTPEALVYAS